MGVHRVEAGEHLYEIAERSGYRLSRTIWDDPGNAALRKRRSNPGVLEAGDELLIPDKQVQRVAAATGKTHRFVARSEKVELKLVLLDFDNRPIAGEPAVLTVRGQRYELVSDGAGVIRQHVPRSARQGRLSVPKLEMELDVLIGELDPIDVPAGWRARLINLGYGPGNASGRQEAAAQRWRWALEEFQCDHQLKTTGEPDAATLAKIEQLHGS